MSLPVTLAEVEAAAAAIADAIVTTPTSPSRTLAELTGTRGVWLKLENLQFTASFKERGARNFLLWLSPEERERGVVAASAGNHAQGVAYHARALGIPATIVMPVDTPFTKTANTEHHGARVVLEGEGFAGALAAAQRITVEMGATFVPAFDDPLIIAGQGTVALEILRDAPDVDVIVAPVGGGGLLAGVAIATKSLRADVEVIGVQVESYAGMLHTLGQAPAPTRRLDDRGGHRRRSNRVCSPARSFASSSMTCCVVPEARIEEGVALALEIEKTVLEGAGAAASLHCSNIAIASPAATLPSSAPEATSTCGCCRR